MDFHLPHPVYPLVLALSNSESICDTLYLDYLARAESHLPPTKLWKLLLKTARALAFVKGGELREGIQLATEAAIESRATGNQRYLDRVYVVDRYLDAIQKMRRPLQEALYGENNVDI